jgi:hypothetical protein
MPLSSVIGAQSIVKPGVCTSTTRPAAPFDGQVIYMTDVDQTAVWDGSQWTVLAPIAGGRNVVINGAMQVAQRETSSAGITGVGYYTADRWRHVTTTLGTWTQSVENDAPTGSGFRKSLKMLCTTADASPAAGDLLFIDQQLEGQNVQQFLKGTASAKPFTMSFWVKSNVTGTYIASLIDNDNTRVVAVSYTISASATWEKKTITFPADTTGVLDNDNNVSLTVRWWQGAGTDNTSGTLQTTWASTVAANRAVGQTNLASAINNYWQITGVQLEAGAVATPFEFEDIGTTLAKCQRYFQKLSSQSVGNSYILGFGPAQAWGAGSTSGAQAVLPVQMRVAPTLTVSGTGASMYSPNQGTFTNATFSLGYSATHAVMVSASGMSGLTTGNMYYLFTNAASEYSLLLSSEF